jgi:hypothetical protein
VTRTRILPEITAEIQACIQDQIQASSNIANVRRKRIRRGEYEEHATHYRTETYEEMFVACLAQLPHLAGHFAMQYYIKQIPWYVIPKRQYDGLCVYHSTAYHLHKEFLKARRIWHKNCVCSCVFCSAAGLCYFIIFHTFFFFIHYASIFCLLIFLRTYFCALIFQGAYFSAR